MKVLVTGDRSWKNPFAIRVMLTGLSMEALAKGQRFIVIHGGARGADTIASDWVKESRAAGFKHISQKRVDAHWSHTEDCPVDCKELVGRVAGPVRNGKLLALKPNLCVAFHDDLVNSKGTRDMVNKCRSAQIPVMHLRRMR